MDNKKKLIALAVLMAVAVGSIIYGLSAPAKGKRGAAASAKAAKNYESAQKADVVGPVQRRAVRSKVAAWRRSPFAPKGAAIEGVSGLAFNGVITDGKVLKAVIGDTIVKKGDKVAGCTMVDIKKDSIVVNDGTGNRELKLER